MPEYQLSKEYVFDIGQIDSRGIARPSAIVDFMQDAATRHAADLGLSGDILQQKHAFWVLLRLKYQLSRPLQSYETVRVTTWPRQMKGAVWYRDFTFEAKDGPVGSAVTAWAVVNTDTRRLMRPKSLGVTIDDQIVGEPETLGHIKTDHLEPCFDRVVRYSDIDVNCHLNNVKAVDILSDTFGLEENDTRWVSQMQVNYLAESTCGTRLTLSRGQGEHGLCVAAFDGKQEKLQAEVMFSAL